MSELPKFSTKGATDAEKISEICSYLSGFSSSIDRSMQHIGFGNLNSDLADKINQGITEHQDLSAFASKNYTKNFLKTNYYDMGTIDGIKNGLSADIGKVDTKLGDYETKEDISEKMNVISGNFQSQLDLIGENSYNIATINGYLAEINETLSKHASWIHLIAEEVGVFLT